MHDLTLLFYNRPDYLGSIGRFKRAMISYVYYYGLRCPGHTSSHSSGPGRLVSADHAGFPPSSRDSDFLSSVFLAWEKSAKRLLSGERYPSRFVIHRFSPCFLGDQLSSCSCLVLVFPVHWMCIPKGLMWAGDRALFEPGLCIHVRGRHWKAGFDFCAGRGLGAGETDFTYTGHLFDVAVPSSVSPHILLHLYSWLSEYCQP